MERIHHTDLLPCSRMLPIRYTVTWPCAVATHENCTSNVVYLRYNWTWTVILTKDLKWGNCWSIFLVFFSCNLSWDTILRLCWSWYYYLLITKGWQYFDCSMSWLLQSNGYVKIVGCVKFRKTEIQGVFGPLPARIIPTHPNCKILVRVEWIYSTFCTREWEHRNLPPLLLNQLPALQPLRNDFTNCLPNVFSSNRFTFARESLGITLLENKLSELENRAVEEITISFKGLQFWLQNNKGNFIILPRPLGWK